MAARAMTSEGTVPATCVTSYAATSLGNLLVLFSQTGHDKPHHPPQCPLVAHPLHAPPPPHQRKWRPPGSYQGRSLPLGEGFSVSRAAWTPRHELSATSPHHPPLTGIFRCISASPFSAGYRFAKETPRVKQNQTTQNPNPQILLPYCSPLWASEWHPLGRSSAHGPWGPASASSRYGAAAFARSQMASGLLNPGDTFRCSLTCPCGSSNAVDHPLDISHFL